MWICVTMDGDIWHHSPLSEQHRCHLGRTAFTILIHHGMRDDG